MYKYKNDELYSGVNETTDNRNYIPRKFIDKAVHIAEMKITISPQIPFKKKPFC